MLPTVDERAIGSLVLCRSMPGVSEHRTAAVDALARAREMATHRVCAPELAPWVARVSLTDTTVLPRWHQDDRGWRNRHRGFHQLAADGAYSRVPIWTSRSHWLAVIVPIAIALDRHVLTREQVSPATLRAYLAVRSGYADPRTGRRCIVRPKVLASVLGCAENTVHRCQRAARSLGLEVVVSLGRMLTFEECRRARARGSSQRGLSSEVALTVPAVLRRRNLPALSSLVGGVVTPTSGRGLSLKSHLNSPSLSAASGEKDEAAPPPQPQRRRRSLAQRAGAALGADLRLLLDWLRPETPGRLANTLTRFATASEPWTPADVVDGLQLVARRRGWAGLHVDPDRLATRPAVLLASMLRDLDPEADHPRLVAFPAAPQPCGACDHGWITVDEATGAVRKCPRCGPAAFPSPVADLDPEPEF